MDVHIGREQITSWKDFLVRYLLIFAGIVSAWAVNQWNESRLHRRTAEQTRASLSVELAADLADVREARRFNSAELARAEALLKELIDALKAGASGRERAQTIVAQWDGRLMESLPAIQRNAWDAAVAGQAVTTLGTDELRRFAAAYAELRRLGASSEGPGRDGGDLQSSYAQWELDRALGHVDPAVLARILVRWEGRMRYEVTILQAVEQALAAALQQPLPAATSGPAAAVSAANP